MTRQRLVVLGSALLIAGVAAFFLRDVIERVVVIPLLYLWWLLGIFYRTIPQLFLWGVLVVISFISALNVLSPEAKFRSRMNEEARPSQGQVEALAIWLKKTRYGNYYKWLLANRLGKLARELLAQREGMSSAKRFEHLSGKDWDPPQDVDTYLDIGLNGSFADFPQPSRFNPQPTPLDLNPGEVVDYLESEMENNRNGNR